MDNLFFSIFHKIVRVTRHRTSKEEITLNKPKKYTSKEIKTIADRIRSQRQKESLSQRVLAEQIHEKKDVIQRLESGKLKIIDDRKLYLIAAVLDCNPSYLTLTSDDPRTQHSDEIQFYETPKLKYTAESFLYSHNALYDDLAYAKKYMHPQFQNTLVNIIHTFVTFHKCGVHYPNTTHEVASKISLKECDQFIKEEFFEEEKQRRKNRKINRRKAELNFN